MGTFLQFELWKDCNNKCKFCFNNNSETSVESKLSRINFVHNELQKKEKYSDVKRIGFIGGEFFGGQLKTKELYNAFVNLINTVLIDPQIDQVLVTTSLIYYDIKQLNDFFRTISHREKLMICTSWDTKYRFHTPEDELLWEKNVEWIHKHFPEVKIHVEICPTQWHIEDVLNNKFNIKDFESKFDVRVDYTDLNSGFRYTNKYEFQNDVAGFFPKRETFLKFLQKVYTEGQATVDTFLNFENMSTLLWMSGWGNYTLYTGYRGPLDGETVDSDYGLPPMYEETSDYIDSHERMRKDVLMMWEVINE